MLTDKQIEELRLRLVATWDEIAAMELPDDVRQKLGVVKNDSLALWLVTAGVIREHSDLRKTLHTLARELTIQMEEFGLVEEPKDTQDDIKEQQPLEDEQEPDLYRDAEQALSLE